MTEVATGLMDEARRALERGDPERSFARVRELLAEREWNAALVKEAGDHLALLAAQEASGEALETERWAVVGTCTTGSLLASIRCASAEEGRIAAIYEGPFGALQQEILDPGSGLHAHRPETVLIVRCWRDVAGSLPGPGAGEPEVRTRLETLVEESRQVWSALDHAHSCRILQHDFERPDFRFVGPAESAHAGSGSRFVDRLNEELRAAAAGRVAWVEVGEAARRVGSDRWSPAHLYHLAKLPIGPAQLAVYARLVQGAWRIAANRMKKVLVTDLDNTLWGGVVGDDGLDGIVLGPGTAAGEGYEAFGRYLVELQRRGVVLAVCSKNDPSIASRAFREHPHMALREEDFAVFHCSWDDKATSMREISRRLNLGLDAMVFVDDNPAECALVRRELPEVVAVHLAGEPSQYPYLIERRCLFDRPSLTREDLERGRMYRSRAQAEELRASATDLDGYLADLEMKGRLEFASPGDMERLAQLEAKTNQFNTTTARFSRAELDACVAALDRDVLAFRLRDRFADHGLVSSVVLAVVDERLEIMNWTLSCRVFARGAEAFIRNRLLRLCRARGLRGVAASYRPTPKNGVIAELFPNLGFVAAGEGRWYLDGAACELPCHIEDEGIELAPP